MRRMAVAAEPSPARHPMGDRRQITTVLEREARDDRSIARYRLSLGARTVRAKENFGHAAGQAAKRLRLWRGARARDHDNPRGTGGAFGDFGNEPQ
jgi:hypothetical protein